jgi:hypothetical protein
MIRRISDLERLRMRTEFPWRNLKGLALAGAAMLALGAGGASAQPANGGPPTATGPGGPPPGGQAPSQGFSPFAPPPPPPMSPAQKLAAALPPPQPGGSLPLPVLAAGSPMPNANPRDLQGTWFHNQNLEFRMQRDMYGAPAPYNMDGVKVLARRVQSLKDGKPYTNASAICRPPGPEWQHDLNMPFQIFQSKDWIEFVFEEYHGRWHVILNPAKAPRPAQKDYMGYSVGHWDGNTLVVETSDFKQAPWLDVDGTPLSAKGKLIQRIRKVDNGDQAPFIEVITTIVDPTYYTRPWSVVRTFGWQPSLTVFNEYNCEEQIGDPSVSADAGLLPEPKD